MKNFIISLALILSISVFGQTKPTSTTTTTSTSTSTQTTKQETKSASTQTKSKSKKSKSKSTKSKSTTPKSGDQVVNKALYTTKEKEKARQNFIKDIDSIGMSPEVKKDYTAIVKKHWARIQTANKDRTLTKDQATDYVNRVIGEQNSEIQRLLPADQYKKHELIMNRYQNSVLYRIEQH